MRKIKSIEVKSEFGAGTKGASLGIDAIKNAAAENQSNFFITHQSINVEIDSSQLLQNHLLEYAKRIESVYEVCSNLASHVEDTLRQDFFPLVLAGDHSTAGGTISGIKMAYPDKRLGVIWIDAHADIHTPYTTPSGNMHGMPLAFLLNEDNLNSKKNDIDTKTLEQWGLLKNIGSIVPKINYEDLVFLGLREYETEERYLIEKNNVKVLRVEQINENGTEQIAQETLKYLSGCDMIYISFDVDSMDPSVSVGTGTPVPNGLSDETASSLLKFLVQDERVCALEVVEVNPLLDDNNKMAKTTFKIIEEAAEIIEA